MKLIIWRCIYDNVSWLATKIMTLTIFLIDWRCFVGNEDLATTLTLYKKQLEKAENKLSDCMMWEMMIPCSCIDDDDGDDDLI